MTQHPAAPLLAQHISHLHHTNPQGETGIIHIPGFQHAGINPQQAAETLTPLAQALSEAIIETLDTQCGYLVIHKNELHTTTQLAAHTTPQDIPIHCNKCRQPVIERLHISDYTKINVTQLAAALHKHTETCQP